jgi:hypothetical protein
MQWQFADTHRVPISERGIVVVFASIFCRSLYDRLDVAGGNWLVQPGRLIQVTGKVRVRVLGLVVPSEAPPRQITDLPADEYERFFENPFPSWLDS